MYTHIHVCIYIYIYLYTCILCVYLCVYIHIYIHIDIHIHNSAAATFTEGRRTVRAQRWHVHVQRSAAEHSSCIARLVFTLDVSIREFRLLPVGRRRKPGQGADRSPAKGICDRSRQVLSNRNRQVLSINYFAGRGSTSNRLGGPYLRCPARRSSMPWRGPARTPLWRSCAAATSSAGSRPAHISLSLYIYIYVYIVVI